MEAAVLVFEGADALDVVGPYRVLAAVSDARAGAEPLGVRLVGERAGPVRLSHGLVVEVATTLDACPPLDALVVPGGSSNRPEVGRRAAQRNEAILAFVRTHPGRDRVTASVCTGAFVLASAGVLDGRRAATHWAARDELVELMRARGASFELVAQRVVWDGDLVTGGGVTSGIDVALAIVRRLCGPAVREAVAAAVERETPPQASAIPST